MSYISEIQLLLLVSLTCVIVLGCIIYVRGRSDQYCKETASIAVVSNIHNIFTTLRCHENYNHTVL